MSSEGNSPSTSSSSAPNEVPARPQMSARLRASSSEQAYLVTPLGGIPGLYTLAEARELAVMGYTVRDPITNAVVDVGPIQPARTREHTKTGIDGKNDMGQEGPKGDGDQKSGSGEALGGAGVDF